MPGATVAPAPDETETPSGPVSQSTKERKTAEGKSAGRVPDKNERSLRRQHSETTGALDRFITKLGGSDEDVPASTWLVDEYAASLMYPNGTPPVKPRCGPVVGWPAAFVWTNAP